MAQFEDVDNREAERPRYTLDRHAWGPHELGNIVYSTPLPQYRTLHGVQLYFRVADTSGLHKIAVSFVYLSGRCSTLWVCAFSSTSTRANAALSAVELRQQASETLRCGQFVFCVSATRLGGTEPENRVQDVRRNHIFRHLNCVLRSRSDGSRRPSDRDHIPSAYRFCM